MPFVHVGNDRNVAYTLNVYVNCTFTLRVNITTQFYKWYLVILCRCNYSSVLCIRTDTHISHNGINTEDLLDKCMCKRSLDFGQRSGMGEEGLPLPRGELLPDVVRQQGGRRFVDQPQHVEARGLCRLPAGREGNASQTHRPVRSVS